jgi:hypothetical protein
MRILDLLTCPPHLDHSVYSGLGLSELMAIGIADTTLTTSQSFLECVEAQLVRERHKETYRTYIANKYSYIQSDYHEAVCMYYECTLQIETHFAQKRNTTIMLLSLSQSNIGSYTTYDYAHLNAELKRQSDMILMLHSGYLIPKFITQWCIYLPEFLESVTQLQLELERVTKTHPHLYRPDADKEIESYQPDYFEWILSEEELVKDMMDMGLLGRP